MRSALLYVSTLSLQKNEYASVPLENGPVVILIGHWSKQYNTKGIFCLFFTSIAGHTIDTGEV